MDKRLALGTHPCYSLANAYAQSISISHLLVGTFSAECAGVWGCEF